MFGHKSKPSQIWSYGACRPVEGLEVVEDQMYKAHQYRNKLCEIEISRREAVDLCLNQHCPDVQHWESQVALLVTQLDQARAEINAVVSAERTRSAGQEERGLARQIRDNLREARQQRRTARQAAFENEALQHHLQTINDQHAQQAVTARNASGLYWGNYLAVDQAAKNFRSGPPPRFLAYRNTNPRVVVQVQKGMTLAEAFSGEDTRLRLERTDNPNHVRAHVRVQSTDAGKPVWAVVPIVWHRDPPEDCRIKWVYLQKVRIGTNWQWHLQLVVERAVGWQKPDCATEGIAGVDLGWRLIDGELRVAYLVGSDGYQEELRLPERLIETWRLVDRLIGRRDDLFNGARTMLVAWLNGSAMPEWNFHAWMLNEEARAYQTGKHTLQDKLRGWIVAFQNLQTGWELPREVPEWFTEEAQTLPQWRSADRLRRLMERWYHNRFAGDEFIYAVMRAWRSQDAHLLNWFSNLRQQSCRCRLDLYRNFAARVRRRYRTVRIEDINWRDTFQTLPPVEDLEHQNATARYYQRVAAVGELGRVLSESAAVVERIEPANTTRECQHCGTVAEFDQAAVLVHTCEYCHKAWDQDQNAATILLRGGATTST